MTGKSRPSCVSRDMVCVVVRDSTSTSPDWSAVKRSLAASGMKRTLVGSSKIAAEIDVEARPVALSVRLTETGEAGIRAAGQETLLLHAVKCRLGRGARCEQAGCQAEGNRHESLSHHHHLQPYRLC